MTNPLQHLHFIHTDRFLLAGVMTNPFGFLILFHQLIYRSIPQNELMYLIFLFRHVFISSFHLGG